MLARVLIVFAVLASTMVSALRMQMKFGKSPNADTYTSLKSSSSLFLLIIDRNAKYE